MAGLVERVDVSAVMIWTRGVCGEVDGGMRLGALIPELQPQ